MKAYPEVEASTVPLILNLEVTWKLVASFVFLPIYPHKISPFIQ
jgi:hypothetical protein